LYLNGNDAFVEDSTTPGSNSALKGLSDIAGLLELTDGASVSTTAGLANEGTVYLDFPGEGGSSLTVTGTLNNTGYLYVGNSSLSSLTSITASSLANSGSITPIGGASAQALLRVAAGVAGFGAAGVLTGVADLAGDSAIEFGSGPIATIDGGLILDGNKAFLEDTTAPGSNSALTGLADIAGLLSLENNASVSTTGPVIDSGFLGLDYNSGRFSGAGGSILSIGGALINTGTLDIGNGGISTSDSLTARSFVNSGTVDLTSNGTSLAALNVSGATTNNGSISIATDTEELAGAVSGKGSFNLSHANLRFDSSVSAGQTITQSGANALTLEQAQNFAGSISGFGKGDTIDAANFLLSGTKYNFVENSAHKGGTLTLHDGSLIGDILMTGHYSKSDFTLAPTAGPAPW
jgi:hypothetical protein